MNAIRFVLLAAALASCGIGCTLTSKLADGAVPVNRVPPEWLVPTKEDRRPIDFALLTRPGVDVNVLGPYDLIGVLVEGVVTQPQQVPAAQFPLAIEQNLEVPALGVPFRLDGEGYVRLPQLKRPLKLTGLTVVEAEERVRRAYVDEQEILKPDVALIRLELIQPNSDRVVVIRGDRAESSPILRTGADQVTRENGSAEEVFLRTPQNDVLHALAFTGGLPGTDAYDEVWILRGIESREERVSQLAGATGNTLDPSIPSTLPLASRRRTRIPLRVRPGEPLPFAPEDVILDDGDVVFVPPREAEHFIVGGLVQGARFELPRDEDVDVLEAFAIATGLTAGPDGIDLNNGFANVADPSRVVVIRTLGSGDVVKILVDLKKAHADPRYRLLVAPDDQIILQYTEAEVAANGLSRFLTFGFGFGYTTN